MPRYPYSLARKPTESSGGIEVGPAGLLRRVDSWFRRHRAALALAFLSPVIAELLTGSTSVTLLFVSPVSFLLYFGLDLWLYASGVLLVREARVRWHKGWGTVLLLGLAYGICEEGLALHTFFRTQGPPVGALGAYGHLWGVNWVWAIGLMAFHAVYSIALPILLVDLTWPELRGTPFLPGRTAPAVLAAFVGFVVLFGSASLYFPSAGVLAFFLGLVAVLVLLARVVPADLLRGRPGPPTAGRGAWVVAGAALMTAIFLGLYGGPSLVRDPILSVALVVATCALVLVFVRRNIGTTGTDLAAIDLATGLVLAIVLWSVVGELFWNPAVALVAAGILILVFRLRRRLARGPPVPPPSAVREGFPPPTLELSVAVTG
jgi:hypothetical protein